MKPLEAHGQSTRNKLAQEREGAEKGEGEGAEKGEGEGAEKGEGGGG